MLHDLADPILVEDEAAFAELLKDLERHPEIAIDTEADSFFSYREKVCLIQITAGERDYLLDPLSGLDVAPIGRVLADARRVKVFHDGEYDLLLLKREYGFSFASLFDTRVAASALGEVNPGLANVLQSRFGVELDKSLQRSNWGARPLSQRQIAYARLDTHFLLPLMNQQRPELAKLGRLEVVDGECRRLEQLEPPATGFDPDEWVRLKGARVLSPTCRRALREVFVLREQISSENDDPPFRVMSNPVLVEIATRWPRNEAALGAIHGLSWKQVRRFGRRVLEALERASEMEPIRELPQLRPKDGTGGLSAEQCELYDRLKAWRKGAAEREGFDASLILNRRAMVRIAQDQPSDPARFRAVDSVQEWQVRRFGESMAQVVRTFQDDLRAGRVELGRRRR